MTDDLPRDRDAAVEALYRMHAASLLQVAVLLVGDEAGAQQVVLDAFADVRVRGRYHDSFEAVDELRAGVIRHSRSRQPGPDGVLAPLTRRQREVFVLRWWFGLPVEEIGELLHRSPRTVARALAEARHLLPDEEELVAALEAQTAGVELSYDAEDQLCERITATRQRRRRHVGTGLAAAVLVLAAVAAVLWTTRPRPYSSPTGRPVFAAVIPVAELATFDVGTGKPRGDEDLGLAQAVASLPGGGWLVSRPASGCRSILTAIRADGSGSRQMSGPLAGSLTALAVSPDGGYAAGVASLCRATPLLTLDVVDLRTGRLMSRWGPPPGSTSISGLSWAPDSRRLAYTLGSGVGGRGSGYGLLDARGSGGLLGPDAPSTRNLVLDGRSCQVVRSLWLGRTGHFAVFAACVDGNQMVLVQVPPEQRPVQSRTVLATLPDSGLTLGVDASATDDGRHLLVTTDVATYRVDGSRVTRLVDARPSPAW